MPGREDDTASKIARMDARHGLGTRVCAELLGYWEALRNGRLVPERSDVQPRGIDRGLEYAFIIERVAPGMARFRLAGMHLCDVMGMEVRGMPLTALFTSPARRILTDATEHVFRDPAIVEARLLSEAFYGRASLSARLMMLPLRSDLGDVTRALGCLITEGDLHNTPTRFSISSLDVRPVVAASSPVSAAQSHGAYSAHHPYDQSMDMGLAEAQTAFQPRPKPLSTPEARRAAFKVVSSD